MKLIILILIILQGCSRQSSLENSILRLGILLQNATQIEMGQNVEVPFAWNTMFIIYGHRTLCLQKKIIKRNVLLKVVTMRESGCSFLAEDVLITFPPIEQKEFLIKRSGNIIEFSPGEYTFSLLSLEKTKTYMVKNCGQQHEVACYRGYQYKENVDRSCSTNNEEFFCANSYQLYCNHGILECL